MGDICHLFVTLLSHVERIRYEREESRSPKWGNSLHYDFRHRIPPDLVSHFGGRRQFQISLNNVSNNETILVSQNLKKILLKLFSDVRSGMKDLSLDDIKEILKIEVRKSILHSGHVSEGHNEIFDSMKKIESLEKVTQERSR